MVDTEERQPQSLGGVLATGRAVVVLAVIALLSVSVYVLFVLVPYLVNDLDELPLAEVASGRYNPKDMWPTTIPHIGGWLRTFGVLSVIATPMALVGALLASWMAAVSSARGEPRAWGIAAAHAVVAVLCVTGLWWFCSPTTQYLLVWQMD